MTTVTDVLGNDTTYEYDTEGRVIKTTDAADRESNVTYDEYNSVASVLDSEGKGHFFEFDYDEGKKEQYARIISSTGRIKEVWYDKDGKTIQVDINGRTVQKIAKDGRNLLITDERGEKWGQIFHLDKLYCFVNISAWQDPLESNIQEPITMSLAVAMSVRKYSWTLMIGKFF